MLAQDQMPIDAQTKALNLMDGTENKTLQKFAKNIQGSAVACPRSTILVLMLVVGVTYQSALRARANENEKTRAFKVMTQNVDAGTDFGYLTGSAAAFAQGVVFTYQEINASNIVPRAAQLAGEIALNHPALVGLQEVTIWRTGPLHLSPAPPSATGAFYDQLNLLLNDLAKQYVPVAVQTLMDVEVPVITGIGPAGPVGFDVRYTDQNVVLVRTDLRWQLALSNIQMHQFKAQSTFPTPAGNFAVLRGWISVDAHFSGNTLRFVTTHLDNDPVTQMKQANELIQALNCEDNPPVALCGDFNADADTTPNPTVATILKGGFSDGWATLHPLDPGFTIPLYIEDLASPPPFTAISTPSHRIDLVFARDLRVTQIDLIGNQVSPPWPSDHAGVLASLRIERQNGD
jgi:endonuclease/exonuclease/phosphatase family metal-dependent hydrolase